MIIYFAHPKNTYNTEYEFLCLEETRRLHPGKEILNPKNIEILEEDKSPRSYTDYMKQMNKYYFPAIDSCDLLIVAKTRNGKISPGVQKEISYATGKGIKIEYFNVPFPENNRHTLDCYGCKKQILEVDACSSNYMYEHGRELVCGDCAGI
jgi:hypothetical protein